MLDQARADGTGNESIICRWDREVTDQVNEHDTMLLFRAGKAMCRGDEVVGSLCIIEQKQWL